MYKHFKRKNGRVSFITRVSFSSFLPALGLSMERESVNKGTRSLLSVVSAKNINFSLGTHIIVIKHLKSIRYKISLKKNVLVIRKSKLLKKYHH